MGSTAGPHIRYKCQINSSVAGNFYIDRVQLHEYGYYGEFFDFNNWKGNVNISQVYSFSLIIKIFIK